MASFNEIQTVLTEQNVLANWVRNGLITTLIALTVFGLITIDRIQGRTNFVILLKVLGILFVLIAIWMFWSYSSISQKFYNNAGTNNFSFLTNNSRTITPVLIFALIILIFLFIYS